MQGAGQSARYASLGRDERFRSLKAKFTRAAAGLLAAFLSWYLLYVLLSVFARDLMARQVLGNINVALLLGVLQFASTFLLAWCYARYARRQLDPLAAQLRAEACAGPISRGTGTSGTGTPGTGTPGTGTPGTGTSGEGAAGVRGGDPR